MMRTRSRCGFNDVHLHNVAHAFCNVKVMGDSMDHGDEEDSARGLEAALGPTHAPQPALLGPKGELLSATKCSISWYTIC